MQVKTSTERLGLSTAPVPVCYTDLPNIELLGLFLSSSFELRDWSYLQPDESTRHLIKDVFAGLLLCTLVRTKENSFAVLIVAIPSLPTKFILQHHREEQRPAKASSN